MITHHPSDEALRLAALGEYAILDTPPEADFDEITALIAEICETPYAVITFMDENRLWFKSRHGISATEIPRHGAFCAEAANCPGIFIVPDALEDPRFSDTLLVQGDLKIRFYAAVALRTQDGHVLGTLCVLDANPRELTELQKRSIQTLGHQVMTLMNLRQQLKILGKKEVKLRRMVEVQKEAESEIRRSSDLLSAVAEATTDAFYVKDRQGRYLLLNQSAANLMGRTIESALGLNDLEIFSLEDGGRLQKADRKVMDSGETHVLEETLTSDNTTRTYHTTKSPYKNSQGENIGLIGISRDITERKKAEAKTLYLNRLYAASLNINDAIFRYRDSQEIRNQACRIIVEQGGMKIALVAIQNLDTEKLEVVASHGTLPTGKITAITDSLDQGPFAKALNSDSFIYSNDVANDPDYALWRDLLIGSGCRAFATFPLTVEGRHTGIFTLCSAQPEVFEGEVLVLLNALAANISLSEEAHIKEKLRFQAEASHRASEERFREMADKIGEVFYNYDAINHRIVYANQAYERLTGISCDNLYADPFSFLSAVHPEDLHVAQESLHINLAGQETNRECRIIATNGDIRWVHDHGVPVFNEQGQVERIVGVVRDITNHKHAEEKLREQATLLDKAQDAILVRDLEHRVLYWNHSAERLYGWNSDEILGQPINTLIYRDDTAFRHAAHLVQAEGEWTGELQQVTRDGQDLVIESRWTLVRDELGRPKSILSINTDITSRRKLEQQFLRAQRMESLGTLAGGIAHDLNNVLAPIMMSIELLKMDETSPLRLNILNTIETSSQRGADMVKQVLSFARGVEGQQLEVQISHLLREIEKIANETFHKDIRVINNIPSDLWTVKGDPTQLHQVVLNLCVNGRDAMPHGGKLTISARNVMLDEHYAAMNVEAKSGPYVVMQVEDTGVGMRPEIVERIFEPFFTTKELGKGTGLGLSTSMAIVKSHGGFLQVKSEVHYGSSFSVFLPAMVDQLHPHPTRKEHHMPRGNGECVLVIDDEEAVRQITQQTLEAFGYRVLIAADGAAAIALYATRQQEINVVLTDMMMPEMDGPAMIQVMMRINPDVRIIAASGLNAGNLVSKASASGVRHFIPKPYTAETLLKTVKESLKA
jgi:PAS domain S-box-containing protein